MKNILTFLIVISFISLTAMEQQNITNLTTASENDFFRVIRLHNPLNNTTSQKLYFKDVTRSSDAFDASKGPVYWFPADGLDFAQVSIEKDWAYLRLIFENKIDCWLRNNNEKNFSLIKTIIVGENEDTYVAMSDDEQYIIKQFWRGGKRVFKLYAAEGSLISACELPSFYTANGRWILFNAAKSCYAVHLTNNVFNDARWYIIDCATGKVLDTIWTADQIRFATDGSISIDFSIGFTHLANAANAFLPLG